MIVLENDPKISWRNYQRIRFIKGFYQARKLVWDLLHQFENTGEVAHDSIDSLLEFHLRALKDLSHLLYRMADDQSIDRKRQRVFDKIMGTLWHELDKCRDNIRLVEAYSNHVEPNSDKTFQRISRIDSQILNAARRDLPYQFKRAKRIMDQLVPLFEQIIPVYQDNDIVLRSLYFSRDYFEPLCNEPPVEYFFRLLFGSVGKGYGQLIESLLQTRHYFYTRMVLDEFKDRLKNNPKERPILQELEQKYSDIWSRIENSTQPC